MDAQVRNFYDLFSGSRIYKIPFYQRSYVWTENEWEQFLSDMQSVGMRDSKFFLGTIISKLWTTEAKTGVVSLIIDGQQRLTTIAIFLKVLYLKMDKNSLFNKRFFVTDDEVLALQHSHIDKDDFEKIMKLEKFAEQLKGESQVIEAYNYFAKKVNLKDFDKDKLFTDVQVIEIVIGGNDDEQEIFNTINSRGVDLTTAELLKNHIFNEETISQYEKYWKQVFEKDEETIQFWTRDLLKGRIYKNNIEVFFNAFLQILVHDTRLKISSSEKLEYAKSKKIFSNYQKILNDHFQGKEIDFVKELTSYAKIYRETFIPDIAEYSLKTEPSIERINFIIYELDCTTMIPFIMYIKKRIEDKKELGEIYRYLESYIMRRIISQKATKNYSDLFSENLIGLNIKNVDGIINYINSKDSTKSLTMPTNKDLLESFLENEQKNNKRGLAILYLLESRLRNNKRLNTELLKYKAYTLEHLMPQKWNQKDWKLPNTVSEKERDHRIKTLGNFTMITQSLNSQIGNKGWKVKLEGNKDYEGLKEYAKGFLTLDKVLELQEWNEDTIKGRAYWLAFQASKVWPSFLPKDEELNEPILKEGILIDTNNGSKTKSQRSKSQNNRQQFSLF